MSARARNDLVVGLSILVGVVCIVAATLWLQRTDFGQKQRMVIAQFRDVGNIRVGNNVTIRGVDAGRVVKLQLADSGWVHVSVVMKPDFDLPPDPVMVLFQQSLFGEWAATFMGRGVAENVSADLRKQLRAMAPRPDVLPGVLLPDIAQLTAVAGQIAGDVSKVAERFQEAFTDSAASELRGTFRSTARLARQLELSVKRQSGNLDKLSLDLLDATRNVDSAATAMRRTIGRAEAATSHGEVAQLMRDANEATVAMRDASVALRTIIKALGESQGGVVSAVARGDSILSRITRGEGTLGMLSKDPSLYQHTDSLVLELRALVMDLKANPKRYVTIKVF